MKLRPLTQSDWPDAEAHYWELTKSSAVGDDTVFARVLSHPGTAVLGGECDGRIVSMVTLHILPNLTYGGRPYGLIENVVTAKAHRGQGLARAVMEFALQSATDQGCYKVMLLTGRGRDAKGFYEAVGFNADEKWGMMIRYE